MRHATVILQYSRNSIRSTLLLFALLANLTTRCWADGERMMGTRPPIFDPQVALPSFSDLSKTVLSGNQSETPLTTNFSDASKVDSNIVVTFKDNQTNKVVDSGEHISVDFINEDIKQVLRYVSELYDLNIIIPAALQGNVTVRLKNATWESLLEAVLGPVGCTYTKHDNIVQICTLESLNKEPLKTETFLLKFAEAKQVAEELKDFIDSNSGGKIAFNERSNVLIITERSKNIQTFASIIEMLDKPETQVMIEAKFVEASTNNTDTRGFAWPKSISTVLKDKEEAAAADAGGAAAGAGAAAAAGGGGNEESTDGQLTRSLNSSKALGPTSIMIKTLSAAFDFSQTESLGKTLSSPTIITMNNVPATMAVVTNYPVPNYSYNSEQGGYEISGFEEKPIGIELKVTPKVQAEFITLKLEPSLSSKTAEIEFKSSGGNNTTSSIKYPQISQKKTDSVVTIKSGYTIAIGGLMSQASSNVVDKTPILGDIPILGKLFSHKNKEDSVTNLLIFLSATQIAYDGTLLYPHVKEAKNISQKKMYSMGITENDLPGDALTESEQQMYQEVQSLKTRLENMIETKRLQETMANTSKSISKFTPYKPVTKARSKHKFLKMFKKQTKHTYVSNQKQTKQ